MLFSFLPPAEYAPDALTVHYSPEFREVKYTVDICVTVGYNANDLFALQYATVQTEQAMGFMPVGLGRLCGSRFGIRHLWDRTVPADVFV